MIKNTDVTSITVIGGSGRSGTTVLRRLLARHESVCEMPEWRVPVDPGGLVDFYAGDTGAWTPLLFNARLRALSRLLRQVAAKPGWLHWYRRALHVAGLQHIRGRNLDVAYGQLDMTRVCPDFNELAEKLLAQLVTFRYFATWSGAAFFDRDSLAFGGPFVLEELKHVLGGFYRAVVNSALTHSGALHYVEKNTWYPLVFDRFLELVPEARLVVIRRDPRDVVCSLMEQRWAPSDLDSAARYYVSLERRWAQVRLRLPATSYLEIEYEKLVEDPDTLLQTIGQFSGIPIVPGPYELSPKSIGRWRKILTAAQRERLESLLASAST